MTTEKDFLINITGHTMRCSAAALVNNRERVSKSARAVVAVKTPQPAIGSALKPPMKYISDRLTQLIYLSL